MRSRRESFDLPLLAAVALLLVIGGFMVYSSSLIVAYTEFQDDTYFLRRQLIWTGLGLVVMWALAYIDYQRWRGFSVLILGAGILLLAAVLHPALGSNTYGATRWLKPLPFLQFQPSEFIKLALVLYMADWLSSKGHRISELAYTSLPFLIILGFVCALVLLQPNFSTSVIIAATAVSIFFIAGANLWHFTPAILFSTAALYLVMTQAAYRVSRVQAWLSPFDDVQGGSWQTVQTLIALGSGGLTGLGLGASRQKHYWLANAHTDAIVAILGEELGLIGTLAVVALLGVVIWRGLRIAYRAPDTYGRLVAAGVTTMLFWQATVNLAVVTNSVPYTGVTLPFVSFGGTSIIVSLAGIGLLLSVARHRPTALARRIETRPADDREPPDRTPPPERRPRPELELVPLQQLESAQGLAARRPRARRRQFRVS